MLADFRFTREEGTERDVVRPRFARLHGEVAAGVTGNPDLRLTPQPLARFGHQAVFLPQMHAIRAQSPGQRDAVVDDERAVGIAANPLERLGELGRLVLVDPLDPKLKRRNRPRPQRTRKALGEWAANIERGDQVQLAGGVWHDPQAPNAVARLSQAFRIGSFVTTIVAGMKQTLILLAPLALVGCVTPGTPAPASDGSGLAYARMGETVAVGGPRVTPLALIEDSRCPQGVQCVWAGRVRISATISTPTMKLTRELTMGEPFAVADGTLTLSEVRPPHEKSTKPALPDYRFGFRFDGGL